MTFDEWWETTGSRIQWELTLGSIAKHAWNAALDSLSDLPEGWTNTAFMNGKEVECKCISCKRAHELKQRIAEARK